MNPRTPRQSPYFIILLLAFAWSSPPVFGQTSDILTLDQLQAKLQGEKDRIQVVNFWATWCAPCLKELPLLEKLHEERKDVHVRLVSLDLDLDPNADKVRNFVQRRKLKAEVIMLDEKDPNTWINKVDKRWSGAIPATLVINKQNGKSKFVEGQLHEGDLEKLIAEIR